MNYEESVIGSVLLTNGKALDQLTLQSTDFQNPSNRLIYKAMLDLKAARKPVDVLTVAELLPKLASFLHETMTQTPTAASVEFYARKVLEEATRKQIVTTATILNAKSRGDNLDAAISDARKEIDLLIDRNTGTQVEYVQRELISYLDELDKPKNYAKSPWKLLDAEIGGFRPGALYIIGARPGVGKTIVGLQIAWELSKSGPVSFHSLEMGKAELFNRIISLEASVSISAIEKGTINNSQWEKIGKSLQGQSRQLVIHDKSGQTMLQIRAGAKAVEQQGKLQAIVVDYLGLIQDTERGRKRYESVTDISIALKNLARDLNVPVIALAQLNRGPEQRKDAVPDMADLRDSGGIEQDADVVILLHREQAESDKYEWEKSLMFMNVAKNRHGQTSKIGLLFQGIHSRVVEG